MRLGLDAGILVKGAMRVLENREPCDHRVGRKDFFCESPEKISGEIVLGVKPKFPHVGHRREFHDFWRIPKTGI